MNKLKNIFYKMKNKMKNNLKYQINACFKQLNILKNRQKEKINKYKT